MTNDEIKNLANLSWRNYSSKNSTTKEYLDNYKSLISGLNSLDNNEIIKYLQFSGKNFEELEKVFRNSNFSQRNLINPLNGNTQCSLKDFSYKFNDLKNLFKISMINYSDYYNSGLKIETRLSKNLYKEYIMNIRLLDYSKDNSFINLYNQYNNQVGKIQQDENSIKSFEIEFLKSELFNLEKTQKVI